MGVDREEMGKGADLVGCTGDECLGPCHGVAAVSRPCPGRDIVCRRDCRQLRNVGDVLVARPCGDPGCRGDARGGVRGAHLRAGDDCAQAGSGARAADHRP